MVKFCSLLACPNRNLTNSKTVNASRHQFPVDPILKQKWVDFVKHHNRQTELKLSNGRGTIFLCTEHFDASCIMKKKLTKTAVPTIAPQFTPETALKYGLIPSLQSTLLIAVNNFDISVEDFLKLSGNYSAVLENGVSSGPVVNEEIVGMDIDGDVETSSAGQFDVNKTTKLLVATKRGEPRTPQKPPSVNVKAASPFTPVKSGKRKLYVEDLSPGDFATPRRARNSLDMVMQCTNKMQSTLKATKMRLKRALHKIHDLNSLLAHLKDERRIPEDVAAMLKVNKHESLTTFVCCNCGELNTCSIKKK